MAAAAKSLTGFWRASLGRIELAVKVVRCFPPGVYQVRIGAIGVSGAGVAKEWSTGGSPRTVWQEGTVVARCGYRVTIHRVTEYRTLKTEHDS